MRTRALAATAVVAAALVSAGAPAHAVAVPPFTNAELVTAPASLQPGALESSTVVRVINESSVRLSATLATSTMTNGVEVAGPTLAINTCVQSHLLHFDPAGTATARVTGSANFSQPIIGLLPFNLGALLPIGGALDNTDGPIVRFGVPGTTYPTAGTATRGLDLLPLINGDRLSFTGTTVNFTMGADAFDEVRVLTGCDPSPVVPEAPVPVLLAGSAAAVLAGAYVTRRRFAARVTA